MSKPNYVCGADSILRDKNNNNKPVSGLPLCQAKGDGGSGFTSHCQIMANGWGENNKVDGVDLSVYNDDYRCGAIAASDPTSAYARWEADNKGSKEKNPYEKNATTGAYTFCDGKGETNTSTPGCILNSNPLPSGFYKCKYNYRGKAGDRCEPDKGQQCKAPCEKILPDKETNKYPNDEDNRSKFWWAKHGCYDESYSNNDPDQPWQDNGCGKIAGAGSNAPCCMFIDQLKEINMGAFNQCKNKNGKTPVECSLEPNQYAGYYSPRKDDNGKPTFWQEQIKKGDNKSDNKLYPDKKFPTGKNKDGIPYRVTTYRKNIERHITNNGLLCTDKMDDTKCFPSKGKFQPKMKPAGLTSDADELNPEKTAATFADNKFATDAHIITPKPQTQ